MNLTTPVTQAGKQYKMFAKKLERLRIFTLMDFLYHVPFRYEDYTLISPINQIQVGETVTVQGIISEIKNVYTRYHKNIQKAVVADTTGEINVTWFNQPFLLTILRKGNRVALSGKVDAFTRKPVLTAPEYEVLESDTKPIHTGRLVPIYPETYGITSKWLRKQISFLLNNYGAEIQDYLSPEILKRNQFPTLAEALWAIHFPNSLEEATLARKRLSYDEMLFIHLASLDRKKSWDTHNTTTAFALGKFKQHIDSFIASLPFTLTTAQKKAIDEIFHDLAKEKAMNRLLEGDVGSGKTVVAAIAMYLSYLNGFQSVFMTPTEILANQHYATISNLLSPLGVNVELITGSTKKNKELRIMNKEKGETHDSKFMIHDSTPNVFVGTHALLYNKLSVDKLGLVVIDEQQRFGVEQRAFLRQKGTNPHVLTMTATPIPRTVALTLYGDLDLSVLDEMPQGRKYVKTWLVPEEKRQSAYTWIAKQLTSLENNQAFIICPFIEESESMVAVKAAKKEFERLQKDVFPQLTLSLLHGKLKPKEKDTILTQFANGQIDILVATPVVEVGIDIPNATIMMIEAADRFGLAQLHQLRGRVGRSEKQSYCLLFTDSATDGTLKRLKAMETVYVGSKLAELDLTLRGPGELFGTLQHGIPKLKVASFSDTALMQQTKTDAIDLFANIHTLPLLQQKLTTLLEKDISPD